MSRLSIRALAVIGAGVFAVALTVGGAGSAGAAPSTGQAGRSWPSTWAIK